MGTEVCPWTLFLTMSLTLLKGLMPHVPAMLPLLVSDPEMRSRAEATFMDPEFLENIKSDIQAPLNRQILQSSETIMYLVKLSNNFFDYFMGGASKVLSGALDGNGLDETDNMPRSGSGFSIAGMDVMQIFDFVRTMYNLAK